MELPVVASGGSSRISKIQLMLACGVLCCCSCFSDVYRTQQINLKAGWNAVFLEVSPEASDPFLLFEGSPIDIVARYFPLVSSVQFIRNPDEQPWNEPGWGVWYSSERPESFLSSLFAIHGNAPYLVHATRDFNWTVTGSVELKTVRWRSDSFNFAGFSIDPTAAPTFGAFFSHSRAHQGQRIYRLIDGQWQLVLNPAATTMRSGEAFWIYCRGGSKYQGPISLELPSARALNFGSLSKTLDLRLSNHTTASATVTVNRPEAAELPLAYVLRNLNTLETTYPALPASMTLPPIGAGVADTFRVQVRREAMSSRSQSTLLEFTTNQGTRYWVPVEAERADLQ